MTEESQQIGVQGSEGDVGADAAQERVTREEKKAQSRRRILESARDVFFRDGFMRANLDEVAEKAGVAKGTLYRYFESKADLYVAVLVDNGNYFTKRMSEVVDASGPTSIDKLQEISKFYLDYWLRHQDYFQIFWAIDNQSVIGDLPGSVVDAVTKLWEASLGILQAVLDEGVAKGELVACDTWEVANLFWSIGNSLIESDSTKARRQLRKRPLEATFAHAIKLLIRGLLADPNRVVVWPSDEVSAER